MRFPVAPRLLLGLPLLTLLTGAAGAGQESELGEEPKPLNQRGDSLEQGDQDEPAEFQLPGLIVRVPQDAVVDLIRALGHLFEERHEARLELCKHRSQGGDR